MLSEVSRRFLGLNTMLMRPHDLLYLTGKKSLRDKLEPVLESFWDPESMPVVVRRDRGEGEWIPVGLRGPGRRDRQANRARRADVLRVLRPEDLAVRSVLEQSPFRDLGPVRAALMLLARPSPARWGIAGSCGFSLASGHSVMRPSSDLDLVVNAGEPLDPDEMRGWLESFRDLPVRADVQISTPLGGFALREWVERKTVLLKTNAGPVLTDRPWGDAS